MLRAGEENGGRKTSDAPERVVLLGLAWSLCGVDFTNKVCSAWLRSHLWVEGRGKTGRTGRTAGRARHDKTNRCACHGSA